MGSMFDSLVYARRKHTPWARVDFTPFAKELAMEALEGNQPVTLTVQYRHSVASRFWWTITWTDEEGQEHCEASQELDLCLWRAAERVLERRARKEREQQEQPHANQAET